MGSKGSHKKSIKANNTPKQLPAHKNPRYFFKPGQCANPLGRPKGSRNKLSEVFLAELLADFQEYGAFAIADCRKEDPSRYCAIIAGILPKEINIGDEESTLEKFFERFTTPEQIDQFLAAVTAVGIQQSGNKIQNKNAARTQPDGVH